MNFWRKNHFRVFHEGISSKCSSPRVRQTRLLSGTPYSRNVRLSQSQSPYVYDVSITISWHGHECVSQNEEDGGIAARNVAWGYERTDGRRARQYIPDEAWCCRTNTCSTPGPSRGPLSKGRYKTPYTRFGRSQ